MAKRDDRKPRIWVIEGALKETVLRVRHEENTINKGKMNEKGLWKELVACILGSNVRYEQAYSAVRGLGKEGLLSWESHIAKPARWEKEMANYLSERRFLPKRKNGLLCRYRYPRAAASRIKNTALAIYGNDLKIRTILMNSTSPMEARNNIINKSKGIGPKQASLFLRNIGYSNDFAVLDTHVVHYLMLAGIMEVPADSLKSMNRYLQIEQLFQQYADSLQATAAEVDLAIWVLMRAFKEEK